MIQTKISAASTLLHQEFNQNSMDTLRQKISEIDTHLLDLLEERMKIAQKIGAHKKANNIPILQPEQWDKIVTKAVEKGATKNLSDDFIVQFLDAIHQESIRHQQNI